MDCFNFSDEYLKEITYPTIVVILTLKVPLAKRQERQFPWLVELVKVILGVSLALLCDVGPLEGVRPHSSDCGARPQPI